MDELRRVYESARCNIPLRLYRERRSVPPWDELDESVRQELAQLAANVLSVARRDGRVLKSHQRVINDFNRGVRNGFLGHEATQGDPELAHRAPYISGLEVGRQAKGRAGPEMELVKQFITATHLLAYEFGQLDFAQRGPVEFLLQNVSPDRADELGDLAFALPVLFNHERDLVRRIVADPDFSFSDYYAHVPPAPSHAEYLSLGTVALFDGEPMSWQRVGAALGLATTPFIEPSAANGVRLAVPGEAVRTILARPMTAHTATYRQMERIELARAWIGTLGGIALDDEAARPATLWDVYQKTAAAHIRSGESYFADLVASIVVHSASKYLESFHLTEQTRLAHYRRHFLAFVRGFDARHEGVVDPKALDSVALGRSLSDGLRRFQGGGPLIGAVSKDLAEVARTLSNVNHAYKNPVANVLHQLRRTRETPLADCLLELFETHHALAKELFETRGSLSLHSRTDIPALSPYDMMRSALWQVLCSNSDEVETEKERQGLLDNARAQLSRMSSMDENAVRPPGRSARSEAAWSRDVRLLEAARLFERNFDTLVRLMSNLCSPLRFARILSAPQTPFASAPVRAVRTAGRVSA